MRIRSSKGEESKDPNAVDKLMSTTQQTYRQFMDYVAFREDDPLWMLAYKLFFRLVGLVIMILLSPFLLISFLIAVTVAA